MKSIKRRISVLLALVLVAVGACALFLNGSEAQAADVNVDMLDVKMQISNTSVTDGNVTADRAIRFISSVDSLEYSEVGFIVNGKSHAIYTVYEKIDSTLYEGANKLEYTFSPKIVDTESEYFFTAKMAVKTADLGKEFTVQAYLKTYAGEVVVGEERVVSIAKDTADNVLNLTVNAALDKTAIYKASFASKVNSEVTSVTETEAAVEVLSVGDGYSNVRITLTGTNKVADMASATEISINGTTATGVYRNYHTSYLSGTNAGKADTSWYDVYASGTEFVIATNADLYGFATINENFDGDSVYLVSDIKANEGTASATGFTGTTKYEWMPIGGNATNATTNFKGTFDGQMHTVSGLYISQGEGTVGSWGLFGLAEMSTIKNIIVSNSYMSLQGLTSNANLGGIVGYSTGIVDTAKVADDVYMVHSNSGKTAYTGGIVGFMRGTEANGGKISNCQFEGTITAQDVIGGIVAMVQNGDNVGAAGTATKKSVEIEHCMSNGTLAINDNNPIVGGICGQVIYAQIKINDSLNLSSYVKGDYTKNYALTNTLVGYIANNPYNHTAEQMVTNKSYTAVINNTYGRSNEVVWSQLFYQSGKGYVLMDESVQSAANGTVDWNKFLGIASCTGTTGYSKLNLDFTIGDAYEGYWTATSATPVLTSFVDDETVLALDEVTTPRTVWYDANKSTYTLYSKADMYGFASLTDNDFTGKTVKLGADIALNDGTASESGFTPKSGTTATQWTPKTLAGTFDGQGHNISGLYLNTTTGNAGLFATVTGTVKNVRLLNSYINCTDGTAAHYDSENFLYGTGSIAGSLNGTIDTVYSDAIVNHKYAYAGGIVGTVYGTGTNLITNSCFAGRITARNAVAGIAGLVVNTSATVEHCLNAGTIGTTNMVIGGLVGYVWIQDGDASHTFKLVDSLNVGRRDVTTEGLSTDICDADKMSAEAYAAGGGIGYPRNTTASNTTAENTYYIRWYTDKNDNWARFNWGSTMGYTDAPTTNANTYNVLTETQVMECNISGLSFLPAGQESSSTDAYYWVARTGKMPMLESFEDLLVDVTF